MSPAQDLQSRMMAAHDDVEEALNQAELAGQFPQPMFRSAFESELSQGASFIHCIQC